MRGKRIFIILAAIVAIPIFTFIGGELVLYLWNWLAPTLFGFRLITFWQAVGLLALCRILFGGLGMRGHGRSNFRRRMNDRWERMTPEERDRLRQKWGNRCGYAPPAPTETKA